MNTTTRRPRPLALLGILALLLVIGATSWYLYKNPERETLDAESRTAAPGQFVTLDAGQTHYRSAGPDGGRVAILVHGFSVPSYIWDSTLVALGGAGYRVIAYDLYGRGWSDRPNAAYDGPFYDAQLNGLLDSLRITGKVDLFGLSFGGFVTAHYASTNPARVRSLTLVDPTTRARVVPGFLGWPIIGNYVFQVTAVPTMADNQASDFLHPERFPGWAERYRPQTRYRGFGRSLRRSVIAASKAEFTTYYSAISQASIPVLLIWGKQDSVLPVTNATDITTRISGAEFFAVDSAGHLPHMEQAGLVRARMLAFLATHE
jgi:pimeloyl-ACP methyl ester carboxylesterase